MHSKLRIDTYLNKRGLEEKPDELRICEQIVDTARADWRA